MSADFASYRRDKCQRCESADWSTDGGLCLPTAEKHGTEKANIEHGIVRASLRCPLGEWDSVAIKCPICNRAQLQIIPEDAGMCSWCQIKHGRPVSSIANKARVKIDRPIISTRRSGNFGSSFRATGEPQWISLQQLTHDVAELVSMIPPDVTSVVGVARSGIKAASMVAEMLHLPLFAIRQTLNDVIAVGNGWRLGGNRHIEPTSGRAIIVDDTVMTGNSYKVIASIVSQRFPNAITSAIYVNPLAKRKPDMWVHELGWPHLLEWNIFNSVLSPNVAMDFDGILCHDCPRGSDDDGPKYLEFITNALPRFLPRKVPIPLIVTARLEKYRAETEAWLSRYGVRTHALIMHPAKTLRQRRREDIAAFKAHHYNAWSQRHHAVPAPSMFIESEDWQARRIAEITHKMVVCPDTAGVYPSGLKHASVTPSPLPDHTSQQTEASEDSRELERT
jgi:hypoxanthine phosphoribosyltransferase/uncharacterized HAD superfamily protein